MLTGELVKEETAPEFPAWLGNLTESELTALEKITKEDKAALILFLEAADGDITKTELLNRYLKSKYAVNISE